MCIVSPHLRQPNESLDQYKERLVLNKKAYGLYWSDIAQLWLDHTGQRKSDDYFRKFRKRLEKRDNKNIQVSLDLQLENDELVIEPLNYKESVEINKDGSQTSNKLVRMSIEESKDVNYLLKAHGYDIYEWELVSARNNIWNVYSKQDGIKTLYSSKITVKPRKGSISLEEVKEFFEEMSQNYKSPIHTPTNYSYDGKMLEINIADLHVGKYCWEGDSGDNYDYQKAKEKFLYIINDVLTRTKHYQFNKILFVWSNDFFHYDTINQTTTAGTRQDTNIRWQNLYKFGVEMLIEGIDLLSQYAPVETFYIGSNHDKMTSYFAIEHIAAWYRNNPNVTVNTDAKSRKYVEFGKCLIGFSHGHAEKKRLGSLMPIEAKEAWGRTTFREFHVGHIHSEKAVNEENGIIVRTVSSPSATDNWHFESGYVGAIKKSQSFVWDREHGLTDILNTTVMF